MPAPIPPATHPSRLDGYLAFHPALKGRIRVKWKTSTIRLNFDRALAAGDVIELQTSDGTTFGTATITRRYETTIEDVIANPPDGHRAYDSLAEAREHLGRYYPDVQFKEDTTVTVIHFNTHSLRRSLALLSD